MLRRIAEASTMSTREDGFTLPEMLVAGALGVMVAAVGMVMMTIGLRTEPKISGRAADIAQARTLIERIGRELRQGETVGTATASQLELLTYVHRSACGGSAAPGSDAILCRVTYQCGATCTRTERDPDGAGSAPPQTVVSGLSGDSVFTYASAYSPAPCPGSSSLENPVYICIRLSFPAADTNDDAVTLNDGVALRNWFDPD